MTNLFIEKVFANQSLYKLLYACIFNNNHVNRSIYWDYNYCYCRFVKLHIIMQYTDHLIILHGILLHKLDHGTDRLVDKSLMVEVVVYDSGIRD